MLIDELHGNIQENLVNVRNLNEEISCNNQELEFSKGRIDVLENQLRIETKKAITLDGKIEELNLNLESDEMGKKETIEALNLRISTLYNENEILTKKLDEVSKDKEFKVNMERKIQIENRKRITELENEKDGL